MSEKETFLSLLTKINKEEMTVDEAVEYALENIIFVKTAYSEDGATPLGDPDNAPNLILWAAEDDYTMDEYYAFFNKLFAEERRIKAEKKKES